MNFNNLYISHVAIWVALAACTSTPGGPEKPETNPEKTETVTLTRAQAAQAGILLGKVITKPISATLEVNGQLDVPPQNMVSVSTMMAGFVLKTKLLQGLQVAKGEEILVLRNPDFITLQQEYLSNKSRLEYLEKEKLRQEELAGEHVSPTKIYQQSLSEFNSLRATQSGLKERLKLMGFDLGRIARGELSAELSIKAPISGSVTEVFVNLGKYVQPQDLICEIVNTEHLHAELTVFEQDMSKIKVGQHIHFNLHGEPGKERQAHIYLINKKLNADRTVRVHAHLDTEDKTLIPNMLLKAKIETGYTNAEVLPTEAVVNLLGKQYVFRKSGEKNGSSSFEKTEVETGIVQDGWAVVKFLDERWKAEMFVVKGAQDLLAVLENVDAEE